MAIFLFLWNLVVIVTSIASIDNVTHTTTEKLDELTPDEAAEREYYMLQNDTDPHAIHSVDCMNCTGNSTTSVDCMNCTSNFTMYDHFIHETHTGEERHHTHTECPSRRHLYFVTANRDVRTRTQCAVRSACLLNPELTINIVSPVDQSELIDLVTKTSGCTNVKHMYLNLTELLSGTPIEELLKYKIEPSQPKGRNAHKVHLLSGRWGSNQLGNAARLVLLYKYGGIYLDTDVWTVRSYRSLPCDVMGQESAAKINQAVLASQNGSQFLLNAMKHFVSGFNPFIWGVQGPMLVSREYKHQCLPKWPLFHACTMRVAKPEVFYPFIWQNHDFFKKHNYYLQKRTIAIHLWNHQTINFKEDFTKPITINTNTFTKFLHVCLNMSVRDKPLPMPFNATPTALPAKEYLWETYAATQTALKRLYG